MQHLPIFPILLPMLAAVFMLLPPLSNSITRHRVFAVLVMILLVIASAFLLLSSHQQGVQVYVLGGWQPPFGITLVADRLSTMMVLLTSVLGCGSCMPDVSNGITRAKNAPNTR